MNRAIHQEIIKLTQSEDSHLLNQYLMHLTCQALFGVQNTYKHSIKYFPLSLQIPSLL